MWEVRGGVRELCSAIGRAELVLRERRRCNADATRARAGEAVVVAKALVTERPSGLATAPTKGDERKGHRDEDARDGTGAGRSPRLVAPSFKRSARNQRAFSEMGTFTSTQPPFGAGYAPLRMELAMH